MKYLVRAIKYYLYLIIVLALVLAVLVAFNFAEGDISTMFVHGYDSLWQIALMLAALAALYPLMGYSSRDLSLPGSDEEVKPLVLKAMEAREYKLKSDDGQCIKFIKRSPLDRTVKMWEDTLTFTRTAGGYTVEGRTKDAVRAVSAVTDLAEGYPRS